MGTGDHKGRPYGGEGTEGHDVGEGRAVPEPPLRRRLAARSHVTGDHKGRPYGGRLVTRSHVTGDDEGRPYGGRVDGEVCCWRGKGGSRTAATGEVGRTVECNGRRRGSPLRGDR